MSLFKKVYALRGATCCENTKESITENTVLLYKTILEKNRLNEDSIISIFFTVTKDITEFNPATALRERGKALAVVLFCSEEPSFIDSMPYVIRILILFYGRKKPQYVYLNGTEKLREPINGKNDFKD